MITTADAPSTDTVTAALRRAAARLQALQEADGHWKGDYGGPLFLLPGLLIAYELLQAPLSGYQRERMVTYLDCAQRSDGGFGLHIEDRSTMLGTTLNYVALRLLGLDPDDRRCASARAWLHSHGGAESVPTWGKVWLAVLGVYEWEGIPPLLPELWLLPARLPFHPSNLWCHTRAVFLPMTYLYGRRARGPQTALTRALRTELYLKPYDSIDWPACADRVHALDLYSPRSPLLGRANALMRRYERSHSRRVRRRALSYVMDHIQHEDESTSYLDIGPVSKAFHMVCAWFDDPKGPAVQRHLERSADYLWDGRDGMKMQGYNGSQFWDLAFTLQAYLEDPQLAEDPGVAASTQRAYGWLNENQVMHDVPDCERYFRNRTKGCFPFSTAEQAWPVTDCTAEGIKVVLKLEGRVPAPFARERLEAAIDVLLFEQNEDGGWSEYERARGPRWLERLNAAEVFGDIMIGYSHPECTSACLQGLSAFRERHAAYRTKEVDRAIASGLDYLRDVQRDDGSWYGEWGICFTYATWFGIEGLLLSRTPADVLRIRRAAEFLIQRQRADGGWGESYLSCVEKRWVEHERSQPVQTAWALLGLLAVQEHFAARLEGGQAAALAMAIDRAVTNLCASQTDDGWPFDMVYGVFNRNCMINYDNYRYYFPMWALARHARLARRTRAT